MDVEIVKTPEAMARGLSGRDKLGDHQGMLFVFDADGRHSFWMKDMKFALDILWLDQDGRIVDMRQDLLPCTPDNCTVYVPQGPARYVLEGPPALLERVRAGEKLQFEK